jgi:hypothetical protein
VFVVDVGVVDFGVVDLFVVDVGVVVECCAAAHVGATAE